MHLFAHAGGGGSGMEVVPEVGCPQRRPSSSSTDIAGRTHEIPLLEHEELIECEGGQMAAFVSVDIGANDALEIPGGEEESLQTRAGVGIPRSVTGLSTSAAHLGPPGIQQTGLLGLHSWELRERTRPAIPERGHHSCGAVGGATGTTK